jgi:hypothetical protein
MAEVKKGALKSLTVSGLAAWIEGKESLFGPLVKIEVAQDGTVGTFDDAKDPPSKAPTVTLDPAGTAACQTGQSKVCKGEAYISSVRQKVLICR